MRSSASTAFSTAPAITSSPAWSRRSCRFAECLRPMRSASAMRKPIRLRRRGLRHRAEAGHRGEPRVRHQRRSRGDVCRRHFLDHARGPRRRRGTWLSGQAARRRHAHRAGHRAARSSHHGAEGNRHRPGDGRDQRGIDRCRGHRADHARRTGAGGDATASAVVADLGDIARGGAHRAVRPAGRDGCAKPAQRRCSVTRAAITSACSRLIVPAPSRPSPTPWRTRKYRLKSIVQRHPGDRPHGGETPKSPATPAPVILITYATAEDAVRRALERHRK